MGGGWCIAQCCNQVCNDRLVDWHGCMFLLQCGPDILNEYTSGLRGISTSAVQIVKGGFKHATFIGAQGVDISVLLMCIRLFILCFLKLLVLFPSILPIVDEFHRRVRESAFMTSKSRVFPFKTEIFPDESYNFP